MRISTIFLLLLSPGAIFAKSNGIVGPFDDHLFTENESQRGSLDNATTSISKIKIGYSTLADVIKATGANKPFRLTHDEESPLGVCYIDRSGHFATVFASGAMGGWNQLDSIYLGSASTFTANGASCVESSAKVFATNDGIHAGMHFQSLCKTLKWDCVGQSEGFHQAVLKDEGLVHGFTTYSGVNVWVHNGNVDWIEIFRIDSQ